MSLLADPAAEDSGSPPPLPRTARSSSTAGQQRPQPVPLAPHRFEAGCDDPSNPRRRCQDSIRIRSAASTRLWPTTLPLTPRPPARDDSGWCCRSPWFLWICLHVVRARPNVACAFRCSTSCRHVRPAVRRFSGRQRQRVARIGPQRPAAPRTYRSLQHAIMPAIAACPASQPLLAIAFECRIRNDPAVE